MPLLFMDIGSEPISPSGSLSAEDCSSNTSGLEREGEGPPSGPRVTKKREKNRDAARKSRRKQTERADELHEELQSLEQANSALRKEIASLRKELQQFNIALEGHKCHCHLKDSFSSLDNHKASSSPPQASNSSTSSLLPSSNPVTGFQILNSNKQTHLSISTTAASSTSPSSPSTPLTAPYSVSLPQPHSLFSDPPSFTSTSVLPTYPISVANPGIQLQPDSILKNSAASQTYCMAKNAFATKLGSFSSKIDPVVHHNIGFMKQYFPVDVAQDFSNHFCESSRQAPSQPPPPQYAAPQNTPIPTQTSWEPSPHDFHYSHHTSSSPESLLSLLTVPSPPNDLQTTRHQPLPPDLQAPDYSLSEFLEINDWILSD